MKLDAIEVVTLFVFDIDATKAFYARVFAAEVLFEDAASAVLKFSGAMVNLLAVERAPTLVAPIGVAPKGSGAAMLLTVRVDNVDEACAELAKRGVTLLNGPMDRPWGRRTAAFADPSGHVWELAYEIG